MTRRLARLALVLVAAGCASTGGRRVAPEGGLERRVRVLEDEVHALRRRCDDLAAQVAAMQGGGAPPVRTSRQRPAVGEPVRAVVVTPAAPATGLEAGRRAHEAGRQDEAIRRLQEYLAVSRGGSRAAEARYLLGESYYAGGDFPQAIVEYGTTVESHPGSPEAPEALYKIALCYYELGYRDNTRDHLARLRRDYPDSRAARASQALWRRLGR